MCSEDGIDEISIAAPTTIAELRHGVIKEETISPSDFGLRGGSIDQIKVDDAQQSLQMINQVLKIEQDPSAML